MLYVSTLFFRNVYSIHTITHLKFLVHLLRLFEPTCANARWALMHRFLSVCYFIKIH